MAKKREKKAAKVKAAKGRARASARSGSRTKKSATGDAKRATQARAGGGK